MNPANHPPIRADLFDYAQDWKMHDGIAQPVENERLVKVMYSNGAISQWVRPAFAWTNWTGGRNWWIKPPDDRLYILMYVVI